MSVKSIILVRFLALVIAAGTVAPVAPVRAAEIIAVRFGPFEQSLPVADLRHYAETRQVSAALRGFLRFVSKEDQQSLQESLGMKFPVDLVAVDYVLNRPTGIRFLSKVAQAIQGVEPVGVQALRSAVILGIQSGKLNALSLLEAYPLQKLTVNLPKALNLIDTLGPKPPTDTLISSAFWQTWVDYQATIGKDRQYDACLFGDSISAALGNSLGDRTYNFAIGGMSSVS